MLDAAGVPWGTLAVLSRGEASAAPSSWSWTSLGTAGRHRFDVRRSWPDDGGAVAVDDSGACTVPLWFARDAPPPRTEGLSRLAPQMVDSCRWWTAFRRCRDPRTLHAWPDGAVTPCWTGPALGRVGDAYGTLAARGRTLDAAGSRAGAPPGRCPLAREDEEAEPHARAAAERWEIAAQVAWLFPETTAR